MCSGESLRAAYTECPYPRRRICAAEKATHNTRNTEIDSDRADSLIEGRDRGSEIVIQWSQCGETDTE